jgi:endonuclease YncB( thermonuclease family)
LKIDKKIDVKKLQFGSKIDKDSKQREDYFVVKDVISPNLIKLNNDITIRLLGIKEKSSSNIAAEEYIKKKTKGKKVFLKYDSTKYDDKNNLLVYLYLDNKTFINAHLIKEKLADVDTSIDFKYKNKFLNI